MALSKNEKVSLWIVGGLLLLALVWIFMSRRSAAVSSAGDAPNYLNYNYPASKNPTGSATGLPGIPPGGMQSDCGCSGGAGGFYTSIQSMLNQFMAGASAIFNAYQQNVYSAYPDSVTQYFNNPGGALISSQSSQAFVNG